MSELNSEALTAEQKEQLKQSCFHLEVGSLEHKDWHLGSNTELEIILREHNIRCERVIREAGHFPTGWTKFLPEAIHALYHFPLMTLLNFC